MRRRLALYALLLAPTVTALHRGDAAPAFVGENYDGSTVTLASARARRASCSGSTRRRARAAEREKARIQRLRPQFEAAGYKVAGCSVDPPDYNRKFAEEHDFGYPLISNGEAVIRQFGACRREDRCTGKRTTAVIRADGTLLDFIDPFAPTLDLTSS